MVQRIFKTLKKESKMKLKIKGFTLIEIVITIAIIVILSLISAPMYTGYSKKNKNGRGIFFACANS